MENVKEAFSNFKKPSIAIDTVILRTKPYTKFEEDTQIVPRQLQVLLVRRPGEKLWHLPGTILRLGETPKAAINRVMDTDNMYLEQLYTMADNVERDERGHIISIVYIGVVKGDIEVSDAFESAWFSIIKPGVNIHYSGRVFVNNSENELPIYSTYTEIHDLMYDHKSIIDDTLSRIQNKLFYSDIGFEFMPEEFTLRELENTFTALNERHIPGFRRLIANSVEGTGKTISGKSFRPAEIYRKK